MANQLTRYATVATVDTAGEGYFSVVVGNSPNTFSAGVVSSSNNRIVVVQFVLPFRASVSQIRFNITTLSVGGLMSVGLYDVAGNRLIHSGAISTTTTGVKEGNPTAVLIEPGVYWQAQTADNTTVQAGNAVLGGSAHTIFHGGSSDLMGKPAEDSSSGVLPATLTLPPGTSEGVSPTFTLFLP